VAKVFPKVFPGAWPRSAQETTTVKRRASAQLVLHCGAKPIARSELASIQAPPSEGRWHPISHHRVLELVETALSEGGYTIQGQQYGITPNNHRFFGVMTLDSTLVEGISLAVGVRNSTDKSYPIGFCAGNRVFTCDNLAFRSDLLVRRKHTRYGERNFVGAIAEAVLQLAAFKEQEAERIERMRNTPVAEDRADALILRAYERGIVGARELPWIVRQWRDPTFADFRDRTLWSLFNAFTTVLRDKAVGQPQRHALQTMRLNGLLLPLVPDTVELAQAV
jgi:hypothetical protein